MRKRCITWGALVRARRTLAMEAIVMGRDVRGEREVMIYNQQENRTHSNESQTRLARRVRSGKMKADVMEIHVIAWINTSQKKMFGGKLFFLGRLSF